MQYYIPSIEQSKMFLTNTDDSGQGYILFLTPDLRIITMFWTHENTKQVLYLSMESLYEHAVLMVGSAITHLTPMHESKTKMCKDFIAYYDSCVVAQG